MKASAFSLAFLALLGFTHALPTLYEVGEEGNATAIMVPVSSTVIPLDDLPVHTIETGFGFNKDQKPKKPANLKDIQLITAKNKHRFVAAAGIQELTKEEFEQFNVS